MRHLRPALLAAVCSITLIAAPQAKAQSERPFQDSWFWGIHAGATTIGTPAQSSTSAATIGAEWMITRTMGGLYVSYDQASFSRTSLITDQSTTTGTRPVTVHDMRTGSIAAVAFPFSRGGFRPYAGLGFAISVLGSAVAQPDSSGAAAPSDVAQATENARSRSTVFAMGGAQYQINRLALFGQLVLMPSDNAFLVTGPVTTITAGVRYNFGSSIER